MSLASPSKIIPLAAGSITILNFLFSIIPVATSPPAWLRFLSTGMKPEFKFIVFIIFTLISSLGVVKFILALDQTDATQSTKATFIAISPAAFAWIVVFNIKIIALSNSLEGLNKFIFLASCLLYYIFMSWKLHSDFEGKGYAISEVYLGNNDENWPFGNFFAPKYLRVIRLISYYFIVVLGGFFYSL